MTGQSQRSSHVHDEFPEESHGDARYSLQPTFALELSGDWDTGGMLEFLASGRPIQHLKFSPAKWALLAILFDAAINSQWTRWTDAFVSTKQIVKELRRFKVLATPTPEKVHKLVHQVRELLLHARLQMQAGATSQTAKEWAMRFLESGGRTGYRIALPPQNLSLAIRGDGHSTGEEKGKADGRSNEFTRLNQCDIDSDDDFLHTKPR